jgi:hypothetical protein
MKICSFIKEGFWAGKFRMDERGRKAFTGSRQVFEPYPFRHGRELTPNRNPIERPMTKLASAPLHGMVSFNRVLGLTERKKFINLIYLVPKISPRENFYDV